MVFTLCVSLCVCVCLCLCVSTFFVLTLSFLCESPLKARRPTQQTPPEFTQQQAFHNTMVIVMAFPRKKDLVSMLLPWLKTG